MIPSDDKNSAQTFTKCLNVNEPLRKPFGPHSNELLTKPLSGCCCCRSNGQIIMSLTADKNFVKTGDTVNLSGVIDNRNGQAPVSCIKVHFLEKRWKRSSGGVTRNNIMIDNACYHHPNPVAPGQSDKFSTSIIIPKGYLNGTAMGSILANYHTISLKGEVGGCCPFDQPRCELLTVFKPENQKI